MTRWIGLSEGDANDPAAWTALEFRKGNLT